ncbi:hypothetical protein [Bradyrhizobium genosp. A]|uniref:hypothetical protein n=1 Tax=Bradyrhizobium genosp. A TaxID=83626 RepID=UPI003CEA92A6
MSKPLISKPLIGEILSLPVGPETTVCKALTADVVIRGVDFRPRRRERIYDADKIWSGDHTMLDYTEI